MAGTIRRVVDCLTNATGGTTTVQNARNCQAIFRRIWVFLDAHPNLTRIASYYGDAASAAQIQPPTNTRGLGYWDEATNLGRFAFGVWRFNNAVWPWYLFLELSASDNTTFPNGSTIQGGTTDGALHYVGMSAAWGVNGGVAANPWAGGSANLGADARANGSNQRWVDPGGGVYVLPRSNNLYGTHAANKQNSAGLYRASQNEAIGTGHAFGMAADDDSFIFWTDLSNDNTWQVSGIVRYVPRSGLVVSRPYAMFCTPGTLMNMNQTFGSLAGNTGTEGGVIMPDGHVGSLVRPAYMAERPAIQSNATYEPCNVDGTTKYNHWPILVWANAPVETTSGVGLLGHLDPDFVAEIYNTGSMDTSNSKTKVHIGGSTALTAQKLVAPWDGTTVPRTFANGRLGVAS